MNRSRRSLWAMVVAALVPVSASAQTIARSFADLHALLRPGEYVVVLDRSPRETWGRVAEVSPTVLTVVPVVRRGARLETTGERRVFGEADVAMLFRSDETGARVAGLYPASWEPVEAVPAGSDLTVVLVSGERRTYRGAIVTAESVRVQTESGRQDLLNKSDILRIERRGVDDPVSDGIVIGALAGAGVGAGLMAAAYASCRGSCDAPARGPMFLGAMSMGTGVGALVGWIADKAHKGRKVIFPAVVPVVSSERKTIAVSVRF